AGKQTRSPGDLMLLAGKENRSPGDLLSLPASKRCPRGTCAARRQGKVIPRGHGFLAGKEITMSKGLDRHERCVSADDHVSALAILRNGHFAPMPWGGGESDRAY